MSSVVSKAVLDPATTLCFPDVTGATIGAYFAITFTSGTYTTGGVPAGLLAWADQQTVDFNGFLQFIVVDESYTSGTLYQFRYIPTTDTLIIYLNGTELASGATVAITDDVVGHAIFNRTTTLG